MITVIVKYQTQKKFTQDEINAILLHGAKNIFLGLPHLYSKQFCFDTETSQGLSVYLWESREHADAFFTPQFLESFQQNMGVIPTIEYHPTVVTVDNRQGDILTN
ncbi:MULTISPECIES: hypothetical protein [Denitratisoma]|uniref:Monooxygenase n=1 Tax=Denitratisoma oestradiolicum TaxID=311182 RepID=A0A6S6YEH7_9PROT|nr:MULTISPECIES: hypothetical protein [Denitratisoma]QDX81964.1 hypothetical protein B9N43_12310 [Denitratisoma sp. DHT3]TWO80731.1 hypothetical protein CBW56_08155 [Denitratisoma oestradiolicum]CAB1370966.1 Monooxygenase [Denitratisoma oestradiolicum]